MAIKSRPSVGQLRSSLRPETLPDWAYYLTPPRPPHPNTATPHMDGPLGLTREPALQPSPTSILRGLFLLPQPSLPPDPVRGVERERLCLTSTARATLLFFPSQSAVISATCCDGQVQGDPKLGDIRSTPQTSTVSTLQPAS